MGNDGRMSTESPTIAVPDCLPCRPDPPSWGNMLDLGDWFVNHCVGPLGEGTLIVAPRRHVTAVAEMTDHEAAQLGPLVRDAATVAERLVPSAGQVYTCLWSHADQQPGHLHWVVQPVTPQQIKRFGCHGPALQAAMFREGTVPDQSILAMMTRKAREYFLDLGR